MKFGRRLEEETFRNWKYYALDYRTLKARLKTHGYSAYDEEDFVAALERELEKIFAFCTLKREELLRHIDAMEKTITAISQAPSQAQTEKHDQVQEDAEEENSQDGDEEEEAATAYYSRRSAEAEADAQRFRLACVDVKIQKVTKEVKELASFAGLNFTGIKKILKKHDKKTQFKQLTSDFQARLYSKPFFEHTYESIILRLSDLWDNVRFLHGLSSSQDKSPGVDAQNIVRKTTKYWVHPDNVVEVKLLVLKHLPVLVFKKGVENDPALNSIYFDNDDLFLYNSRMSRDERAQNLRFRWYGHRDKTDEVWVERKTHHEDWTGKKSIKERFPIKEKYLNAYLRGEYNIRETTRKLRAEGKKKLKDIQDMEKLGDEVQALVIEHGLKPMIRTSYNRTAFQLPADARVRISLDTELCMVREDGPTRSNGNWRRDDEKGYPFKEIPSEDLIKFPYAVLEIKLQTQFGQEAPKWAIELANSHLVEAVPKFSKFHHAVSNFYTSKVQSVPFWFYQMDKSIIKPKPIARNDNQSTKRGDDPDDDEDENALNENDPQKRDENAKTVKIDQFGKIYFSNERTFLRWINFCIQIISLSLLLVNFTPNPNLQILGIIMTILGISCLLFQLSIFHLRAYKLRQNDGNGPFEMLATPWVVTGFMMSGVIVACGLGWMF